MSEDNERFEVVTDDFFQIFFQEGTVDASLECSIKGCETHALFEELRCPGEENREEDHIAAPVKTIARLGAAIVRAGWSIKGDLALCPEHCKSVYQDPGPHIWPEPKEDPV